MRARAILTVATLSLLVSTACQNGTGEGNGDVAQAQQVSNPETFTAFEQDAFPPLLPNTEDHANAWTNDNCLMCHENGVGQAPKIVHKDMSLILLKARCRTCHLWIPMDENDFEGESFEKPAANRVMVDGFTDNAFPPLLPGDEVHAGAWLKSDCMFCHEKGVRESPVVEHAGMSDILLQARCRSCHLPAEQEE